MLKKLPSKGVGYICALAAAFAAGSASAGPDVIVGDLDSVLQWTASAQGGLRSYSVGTVSCNIGTSSLQWVSSTNRHPVISGNLYRLADGRFEQIGQSWLKHGFTALNGTLCGSCANPDGTGATLDPTCSDPYSASLNGQQNRLGPKSDVNAFTGQYPYPFSPIGNGSGDLYKRIIVAESDLTTAGARYFTASMYVAPDDAEAGANYNNASYRAVTVNQTDFNIAVTGATQRTKPAIFAWKENGLGAGAPDPGVIMTAVNVPGDGRFYVAAKATQVNATTWHYEYAIQNLNSDRSGGSYTVPIPAGAIVTNLGFHDVNYHSGEPYSGADWSMVNTGTAVVFSTVPYASNANANALRWDTIYNFRFDANVPPAGVAASLGLFKPGAVPSVALNTLGPSGDGQQHPFNDTCDLASDVGAGAISFSTTGAGTDGPVQNGACAISNYNQIGSDVWFRYTPACTGTHTVNLCGSNFDTKVAVYAGTACPAADSAIACNDDFNCGSGNGLQSQVSFTGTEAQPYLIRVGGYNALTGNVTMTISAPSCGPQPPANDSCVNAFWAAAGVEYTGTTALAVNDGTATCGSSGASPDVWYKYRPLTSGLVRIDLCGSGYDTVLSLHSACGGAQLQCNDDSSSVQNQSPPCNSLSSYVQHTMTAGTTYWIRIAGFSNATGSYRLHINGGGGVVPPSNDDCANRAGLSLGTSNFTTVGASTDGPAHNQCSFFGSDQVTNDVWYNYPSLCDGHLRVSTCGTAGFDTKIAVYSGNNCIDLANRLIACSDDDCGTQTEVVIPVVSGAYYTLRVGGFNGATGSGQITLECIPPCPADYNNDGGVDGGDVDAFFSDWEQGNPGADVNQDGGVDGGDVDTFFALWEAGGC